MNSDKIYRCARLTLGYIVIEQLIHHAKDILIWEDQKALIKVILDAQLKNKQRLAIRITSLSAMLLNECFMFDWKELHKPFTAVYGKDYSTHKVFTKHMRIIHEY